MNACMHGCGRPARPRISRNGPEPRSCGECRRVHDLDTDRRWRARCRAEDPEGYRLDKRLRLQVWRERRRARVAA